MFNKNLLTSLLLLTVIVGCDNDSDDKGENVEVPSLPPVVEVPPLPPLIGTWKSGCIVDDSNPDFEYSYIKSYEFTENELILETSFYDYNLVCDVELSYQSTYSGTYEIGEDVVTPSGVNSTEIDIVLTERTTLSDPEIEDVDYTLLDLFVIEGTYLYLGDDSGEDGARPEDIDYSYNLELQE